MGGYLVLDAHWGILRKRPPVHAMAHSPGVLKCWMVRFNPMPAPSKQRVADGRARLRAYQCQ